MGVEKVVLKRGNGCDVPKKHDEVSMEYTGTQHHLLPSQDSM
jgi:FK506-binding protein 1